MKTMLTITAALSLMGAVFAADAETPACTAETKTPACAAAKACPCGKTPAECICAKEGKKPARQMRKAPTAEDILAKFDADKNGSLDATEVAAMLEAQKNMRARMMKGEGRPGMKGEGRPGMKGEGRGQRRGPKPAPEAPAPEAPAPEAPAPEAE